MPSRYSANGRSTATAATANNPAALLWNPSSASILWLYEIWCNKTISTADQHSVQRCTSIASATPNSTVTPDIDNDYDVALAPPSAALLYMGAFTGTQPVMAAPLRHRIVLSAAVGAGYAIVFSRPMKIIPSNGIAICATTATILQPCEFTFVWEE